MENGFNSRNRTIDGAVGQRPAVVCRDKTAASRDWRKRTGSSFENCIKKPPELAGGHFGLQMRAHDMDFRRLAVHTNQAEEEVHNTSVNNFVVGKTKVLN